ncbi:MAG: ribokinase [Caldilineales bacterium]|nr:ribokinase [Caldilineales bacterium]
MARPLIVLGSLNMDLVIRAPRHPRPGETLVGSNFGMFPGGKGANQAVAVARLGQPVTMIGCVGRDAFGDALIATLQAAGVDTTGVARADAATGVALITLSAAGENTIVVAPGANGAVTPELVRMHEPLMAGAAALLLQLEVPLPAVETAIRLARGHGVPVILNPAPARPLPAELIAQVDYLIPNQHEAALLTGLPVHSPEEAQMAAEVLRRSGAGVVVLTLGEQGALVLADGEPVHVPAFPVEVVDTTAAGDAFVGAFAVALSEGRAPVEAATWGCAAGALACTVLGAQPSLPTRTAVLRLVTGDE